MKQETKHTAGPWKVSRSERCPLDLNDEFIIESGNGNEFATIGCDLVDEGGEAEANAHLIAAAPDMLYELECDLIALEELRDKHLSHTAAVVRALVQKRIEATKAAIAKAKGGTS